VKLLIPEGVEIVNMPRLSDTMARGNSCPAGLKKVGDEVEEGDILAEIRGPIRLPMEFEFFLFRYLTVCRY